MRRAHENYERAVAADGKHAEALLQLALCWRDGKGGAKSGARAAELLQHCHTASGTFVRACLYELGAAELPVDSVQARALLLSGGGRPPALACMYRDGRGTAADEAKCVAWFECLAANKS